MHSSSQSHVHGEIFHIPFFLLFFFYISISVPSLTILSPRYIPPPHTTTSLQLYSRIPILSYVLLQRSSLCLPSVSTRPIQSLGMASPASLSVFLCLCLLTVVGAARKDQHRLVLPLRAMKVAAQTIPRAPSKLLFRHNVSLTVTLSVGTPPQNVSMVLDTGSELSWLLCDANSSSTFFRPRSSSTYSPVSCSSQTCRSQTRDLPTPASCNGASCHVSLSYADASFYEGVLASDNFRLGGSPPYLRTAFGCMGSGFSAAAGDSNAVGLLGMNRGALSFISQTATKRFAYCISDRDSTGILLIGGGARPPVILPLNYTPLIQISLPLPYFDRVAYSVQLEGIRVGAALLPIPKSVLVPDHTGAGQTMVDSGSQFTFLLGPAYEALKTEFLRQTKGVLTPLNEPDFVYQGAFDTCFRVPAGSGPPAARLPAVALMMRGAEVAVVGERLLVRAAEGVWCLTFGNSDLAALEAYIIGHHHQQNVWVEYDLQNSRVGFAPVRCDLASQQLGVLL